MTKTNERRHQDVEAIVIQKFMGYLGGSEDLPLKSRLYADLGLDSITLVVILLDLSDEFRLDLKTAQIDLNMIQTVEEVISLFYSLQASDDDRGI